MKRRGSDIAFDTVNIIICLAACAAILYPFLYILSVSLSDSVWITRNAVTFYPLGLNLEAFKRILAMEKIRTSFLNSIFYAGFGTMLNLVLTTMLAFPLSRKHLVGRKFFVGMIVIPLFFSGGIIPTYMVVHYLGIKNTLWSIVLPWAILSYYLILVKTFFEGIPEEILESASIDGSNDLRTYLNIVLPLSATIIATVGLFYAVDNWNNFSNALFYLYDQRKYPLSLVLKEMLVTMEGSQNTISTNEKLVVVEAIQSAVIVISVLPLMLIYPFVHKYFRKGITLGALKG
jgi:putative aldouronate transport system permease protein